MLFYIHHSRIQYAKYQGNYPRLVWMQISTCKHYMTKNRHFYDRVYAYVS